MTNIDALCQIIVTCIPDKVIKDKFILLDLQLDIHDEITYFIDDIVTSYYKLSWHFDTYGTSSMEEYVALSHIYKLSHELAKTPDLYYCLGYLLGYRGEELILLLYSHFKYKLSLYSILMAKYFNVSSFPIFSIHLHQNMLTIGLDDFYFEILRHLHLL